jgi:hypothetical protein
MQEKTNYCTGVFSLYRCGKEFNVIIERTGVLNEPNRLDNGRGSRQAGAHLECKIRYIFS